jgi:Acyl-CoA dehydrogenase, C-terminal domain
VDAETVDLVRTTFRHILTEQSGAPVVGSLRDAGLDDIFAEDQTITKRVLFEEHGRGLTASAALDLVVLSAIQLDMYGAAVVYPDFRWGAMPSSTFDARTGEVAVSGIVLVGWATGRTLAIPCAGSDGSVHIVVVNDPVVEASQVHGIDPEMGLTRLCGNLCGTGSVQVDDAWSVAVAAAQVCIGYELVGLTQAMLDMSVEHVLGREQFGRPIGSFQAVKHRLAETHVALVAAREVLDEASESGDQFSAAVAKAIAGRAAAKAGKECQQVTGAMGFTWEHPLHRYISRARMVDALLGGWRSTQRLIGGRLIEERSTPRLGQL